jgi:hypothetical protein
MVAFELSLTSTGGSSAPLKGVIATNSPRKIQHATLGRDPLLNSFDIGDFSLLRKERCEATALKRERALTWI